MKKLILFLALLVPALAWSGDEFQIPVVQEGSAYESTEPKYSVIGAEIRGNKTILWVVASPKAVLTQKGVNRIIRDIRKRHLKEKGNIGFNEIWFYSSVGDNPKFPAFRITDNLAVYRIEENKTYFGVAAKELYGGWAHGPFSLN